MLLLLIVVLVATTTEELLEEILFLFGRKRSGCLRSVSVRWSVGCGLDCVRGRSRLTCCRCRRRVRLGTSEAKDPLDKALGIFTHLAAVVLWGSAIEEGGSVVAGAGGVGQQVRGLVEGNGGDALGRGERFDVGVLGELDGSVHELRPDGSGCECA